MYLLDTCMFLNATIPNNKSMNLVFLLMINYEEVVKALKDNV